MNSEDIDSKLKRIQSIYDCRDIQICQLFHYLNLLDTHNIVAYGPRATCKTSIVRSIVKEFGLCHAWIDVIQYFNNRAIYESILKQLRKQLIDSGLEEELNSAIESHQLINCANSIVFIEKLESILKLFSDKYANNDDVDIYKSKFVIVLDNIEPIFQQDNEEFIYLMNNIQQLVKKVCSISVVYISSYSLEWFIRRSDFKIAALQVVFNNYSNDELSKLLTSRVLSNLEYSEDFYSNYVNIILRSLTPFTRNFSELQSVCLLYFKDYIKPIEDDEMSVKDSGKLFIRFQSTLQEIIENLSDHKAVRIKTTIEMTPSMNYMLIAAYLASYNSSKNDKRFFVRNQGRIRSDRRQKESELDAKPPKPFTFERVINIYQSLLNLNESDEKTRRHLMMSSIIFQQFNELIKKNLIYALNSSNNIMSISSLSKYQLSDMVTTQHIIDISFSIRLNLNAFTQTAF